MGLSENISDHILCCICNEQTGVYQCCDSVGIHAGYDHEGDRVLGNRLAYIKDDPERYDIVIFKYPDDPSKIFIKRVIGLPGETVTVKDGKVYIDGKEQTQAVSFCPEEMAGSFGPYEVPEDSYFVMGDNRNNSLDSRYWDNTYVKKEAILAKAGFRYWPLNKVGFVNKSAEK